MSVWQGSAATALCGSEGELVSVSVYVEPRDPEALLEALAHVDFPINPQIHHAERTAVVFPAYAGRLAQVREAAAEIAGSEVRVKGMLEEIQSLVGH